MAKTKRSNPAEAGEGASIDMTPMIDVTFLLIVFFMCVTEIADAAKASLKLPQAQNGIVDDRPAPGRLLINILQDGKVVINAMPYTAVQLNSALKAQYALSRKGEDGMAEKPVLIRADTATRYEDVQKIMQMCTNNKLYRISFAALAPKQQ